MFVFEILFWGLLARLITAIWFFPSFDEFYYYLYSRHLDWSYFDHPVLVALTTGFGPWVTGVVSPLTIRLGAVILYTGSLYLLYLIGVKLFGTKAAQLSLAIASIIPIFQLAFGVLTLPDSPLIFFWSASLYCAVWEFFDESTPIYRPSYRLCCLGILVGLTCLSKYHGFVLALGLLGFAAFSPRHRHAFGSYWAIIAIFCFLLTIFPLLYWNLTHDWVSFRFHLYSRFQPEPGVPTSGYSIIKVLVVFLANILYLLPPLGLSLWWVIWRSLQTQKFPPQDKYSLIFWVSLPMIVGFTLLGGSKQILAAWPMAGFWGITLLWGDYAVKWSQDKVKRWLKGSAIAVITLVFVFLCHLHLGILQKPSQYGLFGGFVSPKRDPSTEIFDVRLLEQGFRESPALNQALQSADFIFTNTYYLAGLIDFAITPLHSIPVTCLSEDMRGFAFWFDTEEWLGKEALYITIEAFSHLDSLNQDYSRYFQSFKEIGTIPIRRGGEVIEVFHIYQAKNMTRKYEPGIR